MENLQQGITCLCAIDTDLQTLHTRLGNPPMWAREPGYPTLVHIILEQQVSLASARAAFNKLQQASGGITPSTFLTYTDEELKTFGFSRQKSAYSRGLALAILEGKLDLEQLPTLDDNAARTALTSIKGIGAWSADIYLLMVLLRPDSWPSGDLALAIAVQETKNLPARPGPRELEQIALPWQPWRAVAARMLWYAYLRKRGLA